MMNEEYSLAKIVEADKMEIELLALETEGNKKFNTAYIQHWYFDNPSNSFSLWKVVVNNKIEGYATTNNFRYIINGKQIMVAMPQNVLTSARIRGKGLFNKLYLKTEFHNINENHVSAFLTFTNSLSTPIFLNKFNYIRGKCPIIFFDFFSVVNLFKKKNFERLNSINEIESSFFKKAYYFDNAMQKNEQYYKWRYSGYTHKKLHIIKVFNKEDTIGYVFLKEEKRKGIKFLILMDIIAINPEYILNIIKSSFNYSSRKFYFGTMMFDLPSCKIKNDVLRLKIKDRFNFLVKGKDADYTNTLSGINFNMFFGDMDIV
jgi:hypothetical protein